MFDFDWRDALGLLGFVVTIVSLWLAFWQLRKTANAAEASRDAAERMLGQNRDQFRQYVASNLRRYLAELRMFADGEAWDRAALRLEDVAEQLSQLMMVTDAVIPAINMGGSNIASNARDWADICRKKGIQRSSRVKFSHYLRQVHGTIDAICGPFAK